MQEAILYDTHAHTQFNAFKDDGHEVIRRTLAAGTWMNVIGSQIDTSRHAVEYAEKYEEGVYATVGLHPTHLFSIHVDEDEVDFKSREESFDPAVYRTLAQSKKVVGIGECGLEYFRLDQYAQPAEEIKVKQKEIFRQHLELAHELNLPLSIHCREAYDDLYEVLVEYKNSLSSLGDGGGEVRGVMHCYLGAWEQAQKFLDLGLYISFSGIVTFKNAKALQDVARQVPVERLLVETDCPYLTPEPHRGERNEPTYVEFVARKIAELKDMSFDEVARVTTKNARQLFKV